MVELVLVFAASALIFAWFEIHWWKYEAATWERLAEARANDDAILSVCVFGPLKVGIYRRNSGWSYLQSDGARGWVTAK